MPLPVESVLGFVESTGETMVGEVPKSVELIGSSTGRVLVESEGPIKSVPPKGVDTRVGSSTVTESVGTLVPPEVNESKLEGLWNVPNFFL